LNPVNKINLSNQSFSNLAKRHFRIYILVLAVISAFTLAYIFLNQLSKSFTLSINAHDFGIQVGAAKNALYQGNFFCDVINMNYLGDHFSPSLILLAPVLFFSLHPFWVLLLQNIVMVLSLWQTYRIFRLFFSSRIFAVLPLIILVPNLYFTEIFKHDFHIEAFGFYLFLLLIYEQYRPVFRPIYFFPLLVLLLGVKEDVSLVLTAFFGIQFLRFRRKRDLLISLSCLLYFGLTMKVLMPYFSDGIYTHMHRYQSLGNSPSEVFKNLFSDPMRFLAVLKWDSIHSFMKSFYYFPVLAFPEFLPALVPMYYNNASDYFVQSNFWWIHSYLILPLVILSTASAFRILGGLLNGTYWDINLKSGTFTGKIGMIPRLRSLKELIVIKSEFRSLWFFTFFHFIFRNYQLVFIWLVFLSFTVFSLFGRFQTVFKDSYVIPVLISDWKKNQPIVDSIETRILKKIPLDSRIASCGELQPHLLGYSYSGFLGLPQWDSLTFVNTDYLIFLEDRTPWPFGNDSSYAAYKQARLDAFAPFYKDDLFLVLKKKDVQARP
jgi:uncharacterized membrane protein